MMADMWLYLIQCSMAILLFTMAGMMLGRVVRERQNVGGRR